MFGKIGDSSYTKSVRALLRSIQDQSNLQDCLFEQAKDYFNHAYEQQVRLDNLKAALSFAKESASKNNKKTKTIERVKTAEQQLKNEQQAQQQQRLQRQQQADKVLQQILQHSEGCNWQETQINSAKLLGTVFLFSPAEGPNLQRLHQNLKPLYRAVLAVRLLDKLLADDHLIHPYINRLYCYPQRYPDKSNEFTRFQRQVVMPLLAAAILQDIGLLHPEAQNILQGENAQQNEFRLLGQEDRLRLLKLNVQHSLDYLTNGLGMAAYIGNSKTERDEFVQQQQRQLAFSTELIKDAFKIKQGIGNLLKGPQIYASVILSSKDNYIKTDSTKACLLLAKAAEKGTVSTQAANAFTAITGHFPQGFGITYIPIDDKGRDLDRYEYAIVNRLNPVDPKEPHCRLVTRNQSFNSFGSDALIPLTNNLYYRIARQKLQKLPEQRLQQIMQALYSNYQQNISLQLLPRHWQPYTFFCYQAYQNLWNKADTLHFSKR